MVRIVGSALNVRGVQQDATDDARLLLGASRASRGRKPSAAFHREVFLMNGRPLAFTAIPVIPAKAGIQNDGGNDGMIWRYSLTDDRPLAYTGGIAE